MVSHQLMEVYPDAHVNVGFSALRNSEMTSMLHLDANGRFREATMRRRLELEGQLWAVLDSHRPT